MEMTVVCPLGMGEGPRGVHGTRLLGARGFFSSTSSLRGAAGGGVACGFGVWATATVCKRNESSRARMALGRKVRHIGFTYQELDFYCGRQPGTGTINPQYCANGKLL